MHLTEALPDMSQTDTDSSETTHRLLPAMLLGRLRNVQIERGINGSCGSTRVIRSYGNLGDLVIRV